MKKLSGWIKNHELSFFLSIVLLGFLTVLPSFLKNDIPFWYDPARDLLLARDNLHKLTLIGPTSGVPGIFYGPYWIWFLSLVELFTKDPRNISFLVQCLPYFTIFPFLLYRLRHLWGIEVSSVLFLLFVFGYKQYLLYLWNPHLAPLFLFCIIYLLLYTSWRFEQKQVLKLFSAGFLTGIFVNFHISFGLALVPGITIFFFITIISSLRQRKEKKYSLLPHLFLMSIYYLGLVAAFAPFFLFEIRHGFQQSRIALETLINGGPVANIRGLNQQLIMEHFIKSISRLFSLPVFFGYLGAAGFGIIMIYLRLQGKMKTFFSPRELVLGSLVGSIYLALFYFYLTAKNPVWEYHFIGVEILSLFYVGVILHHFKFFRYATYIWIGFLVMHQLYSLGNPFTWNDFKSELTQKENVVRGVENDAGSDNYSVFIYNPAIYAYDYSYLFGWMAEKDIPYRPELVSGDASPIYVIIPGQYKDQYPGFVRFRTPDERYATEREWEELDGTRVVKRLLQYKTIGQ